MTDNTSKPSHRFSTRPLYLQVKDALAQRIASGEWKAGNPIPNESDLAREAGVSPGTVRKALDTLEGEHMLTRIQGRGTFVNDHTSAKLVSRYTGIRGADGKPVLGEPKSAKMTEGLANESECARLGLCAQDRVYRIRRVQLQNGQTFMVEEISLPAALFPRMTANEGASQSILALARQYGILLGKAVERLSIARASDSVADTLGIAHGSPVLQLDRVLHALDGRPVQWRVGRCHLGGGYYVAETG